LWIWATEARLPKREQSKLETYNIGEVARGDQDGGPRGEGTAGDCFARGCEPVQRLFEMEVRKFMTATVPDPICGTGSGERTKVAVMSRDKDVIR